MNSYKDLLAQLAQLDAAIAAARTAEREGALKQIRSIMAEFEISATELQTPPAAKRRKRRPLTHQYRDPNTGATWSGWGRPPDWIVDKDRDNYRIEAHGNLCDR